MHRRNSLARDVLVVCVSCWAFSLRAQETPKKPTDRFQGALHSAAQATDDRIRSLKGSATTAIVVELRGLDEAARKSERDAGERVRRSGLDLYYWIEVARCPELAEAHPLWMASLQGHQEWRRFFPDAPRPDADEVVKAYPWVPVLYKEAYEAQLERVVGLLKGRPAARGVLLNDLQGAPSACGCGNPLCRWTADYGKIRTATPLGDDAAARFVAAVEKAVPDSEVIPVWTTECEEHDGAKDGLCAGVGCFKGICWRAYTAQLTPVAQQSERNVSTTLRHLRNGISVAPVGWQGGT